MFFRLNIFIPRFVKFLPIVFSLAALLCTGFPVVAQPQRVLGVDVSWNNRGTCGTTDGITQTAWNTAFNTSDVNGYTRQFVFVRATRGGTTGLDEPAGTPCPNAGQQTLSRRYDDPEFLRTVTRATTAGLFAGPYHFGRPDNAGNTGTDEADHFIEYASAYMRPGYLMPMYDMEAGSGGDTVAQFAIDFSDRLFGRMQIRPCIYINGNYSSIVQGATAARRDALAKPTNNTPSVLGPCYPMLWDARYSDNTATYTNIPVQTGDPKNTYTLSSGYYGPWDDYGNTEPWSFWQYASVVSVPGITSIDPNVDGNVSHGDIEYVKNYLVPAVWWSDASGDWSTLTNWNSGQPLSTFNSADLNNPPAPYIPHPGTGQTTPFTSYTLPVPRLPGAAGSGPTSGQYDTVILERPSANITVTLSTGAHNIRKLYVRETLKITGGSLTVNYDPTYRADNSSTVLHGGPLSAQFSGPVALSNSASFTVHTLQVDTNNTFTLAGGTLTFNTINLMPHSSTPAKILINGDVNLNPLSNNITAVIAKGSGSGSSGFIDLGGATRIFTVTNGTADIDLSIAVPISNGALTKAGAGTMQVISNNTYTGGTIVSAGRLLVNNTTGSGTGTGGVTVNGGFLGGTGIISGAITVNSGGTVSPGASIGTLTFGNAPTFGGTNFMEIDRNGGSPLADKILLSSGTLTYGGTLVVTNTGAALISGDVFTLFSAPAYSGAFAATILPTLTSGLSWDLGSLAVNGTIKVVNSSSAPTITTQPQSLVVTQGNNATFAVTAGGTTPLSYQWQFNAANIAGATTNSYTKANAQSADAGSYSVVITNSLGTTNSANAILTVRIPPSISAQPQSLIVTQGNNATFTVTAAGDATLGYVWRKNGTAISGATQTSYTVNNSQTSDAATYTVVVTNGVGSATSSSAVLTVLFAPGISTQPQSLVVTQGNGATFTVTANGNPSPGYQWKLNGGNIAGATVSTYTKVNAQAGDAGTYSVIVTNTVGTSNSANAILTVRIPPSISAQPQSLSATQGNNATFTVTATGDATLGYQWRFNGTNITGATDSSYTRNNIQASDAGSYSAVVTNGVGSSNSANAVLTVKIPPGISAQPQSLVVTQGNNATFTVTASGDAPLGYQWQLNGGNISGATASAYTKSNAQTGDAGSYSVLITNGVGSSNSANAVLTVRIPPSITTQPQSVVATQGSNVTFAVTAAGDATLGYQWRFNGTNISSATGSDYTRNNIQTSDEGSYSVVITNATGSITSSNATLAILVPPSISSQPQSVTTRQGTIGTFSITSAGTAPLKYQWRFNGGDISGATDTNYSKMFLQSGDVGSYAVVVTNSAGAITSLDATVTFTAAPPAHIDSIAIAPDKHIHLQINGGPGNFEIQEASLVTAWNPLTNFVATNSIFEFVDDDTNVNLRYYRVKSLP